MLMILGKDFTNARAIALLESENLDFCKFSMHLYVKER